MTPAEITILILQIVNIVVSALSPLINAFAYFIKHIQKSTCMGSSVDMRKDSEKQLNINP